MSSHFDNLAQMSIQNILNPAPPPKTDDPDSSFFEHLYYSNVSMPLRKLLESPVTLPVARQDADLYVLRWGSESISSPDYAPPMSLPIMAQPVGEQPLVAPPAETASNPSSSIPAPVFSPVGTPYMPCYYTSFSTSSPPSLQPFEFSPSSPISTPPSRLRSLSSTRETDVNITRYEDGEVLRYGAGESYRPFNNNGNNNTSNRDRSPPRRARSPLLRDRDRDQRQRSPPVTSDSYVPGRSPRRRSRSADRYRGPDRPRDNMGGESWRRRDNSRSRVRSPVRRPSPPARRSPRRSPPRFSPAPRRDDRFDRARSPRRDFDNRDIR